MSQKKINLVYEFGEQEYVRNKTKRSVSWKDPIELI